MYKKVNFDCQVVDNFVSTQEWEKLSTYIKKQFQIEIDETGDPIKLEFSEATLEVLYDTLKTVNTLKCGSNSHLTKEIFKSFRNCACTKEAQHYLAKDDLLKIALDEIKSRNKESLKFVLQFLLNLTVSNEMTANKVFDIFFGECCSLLQEKIALKDTIALMYHFSLYKEIVNDNLIKLILACTDHAEECSPWIYFLLEKFVKMDIMWLLYNTFEIDVRITILEITRTVNDKLEPIPNRAIDVLTKKFLQSSDIILQATTLSENSCEPYECSLILELIASLSSKDQLNCMQNDKSLLIHASALLLNVHRLGKSSDNCFTSVQKLSELRQPNEEIVGNPAFCFKADLVRLIGNLCWKCEKMQNLAREAEVIPVLLDCCNMDARNPFIIQWVILAIRNLCESNIENQKFIANLHQEGTVDSDILNEMGLTLHTDGENQLKIIPLDSIKR